MIIFAQLTIVSNVNIGKYRMKKKIWIGLAVTVFLIIVFKGCGSDPVKVELTQRSVDFLGSTHTYPNVVITSTSDDVTVNNVIVNKGNCTFSSNTHSVIDDNQQVRFVPLFPSKLAYGKQLVVNLNPCEVLSVDVVTDKGEFTSTF